LRGLDGWVCNSQSTLKAAQDLSRRTSNAIVAYPGRDHIQPEISDVEITERALAPGPLRLLFLGSVIQRKGLETLLQAVQDLPKDTWQLEVIGDDRVDPSLTRRIQTKVEQFGLQSQIRLHGALGDDEIKGFLFSSHVLAVPSVFEGYGIAFLEAMGYGVVPIASNAGGPPELIEHGSNGFLIPPGDVSALREHLHTLIVDRRFLTEIALQARARYLLQPTWDQTASDIRAFLLECIDRTPSE
jgi:glycosyltransferase involved in cell wall biosynthesis